MGLVIRRSASVMLGALLLVGAPVVAQSPRPGGLIDAALCLVTVDELNELSGLHFVRTATGPLNCTYDSDPTEDLYTLDLRLVPPDDTAVAPPEDGLQAARIWYPEGQDTTIGDLPAWESPDGVWVDVGDDLLVIQPILFFMADPPDPSAFLGPLAELAVSRLPGEGS